MEEWKRGGADVGPQVGAIGATTGAAAAAAAAAACCRFPEGRGWSSTAAAVNHQQGQI